MVLASFLPRLPSFPLHHSACRNWRKWEHRSSDNLEEPETQMPSSRAICITAPIGHAGDPGSSLHKTCDYRRGEHVQFGCAAHFLRPAGVLAPALQHSAKGLQRSSEEPGCGPPCLGLEVAARQGEEALVRPSARNPLLGRRGLSAPTLSAEPRPLRGGTAVPWCTWTEGRFSHTK